MAFDVHALIEKQRASLEATEPQVAEIVLGGELVDVSVTKMRGDAWETLAAEHEPRTGTTDARIGFNAKTLPGDYPVERLLVGGEPIDAATWRSVWESLDPPSRTSVVNIMWGANVLIPMQERIALGKARSGVKSGSPANRASRRAASKGGSPRK